MANLIGSLRLISTFDWSEFFESVSLVEQVLQRDPAGVYSRMDFRSRDRYRHAVEELAEPTGEAQLRVALKSVERARQVARADAGRARGARRLPPDWRRAPAVRAQRRLGSPASGSGSGGCSSRYATPGYLGAIALGTALLVAAAVALRLAARLARRRRWSSVALLTLVPASELTIQILQRIISYLIPPRRLPRLELDRVPASARTMVIVPTILDSVERVARSDRAPRGAGARQPRPAHPLRHPQRLSATRRPRRCRATPRFSAAARAGIDALNAKHADGRRRPLLPVPSPAAMERAAKACGWDGSASAARSRSSTACCAAPPTPASPCTVGDLSILPQVRYCITLDSDTRLPRDAARAADRHHHAPAQPRRRSIRAAGRVTEGYGILQPRVSVTFTSAAGSLFARLYSGHTGVDPYTTAVSDTYQDLFGEGIFTGKGLYDVDAFIAALEDSVPENALLSHDLFEGLHARVALVSDVELVDEYPSSVLTHARRQHRWIRGDWQILFWLFPFVPSRARAQAQHAAAHRPLEDPRQPAPQPGGADAAGAARRRLDRAARARAGSGR